MATLAPHALTGTQKSAILMMLLGEDEAADLLKHLGPREVQNLGHAMFSVADVGQDTVNHVLDEFILVAREQTSLGLGTGPYVKNVLVKALGEEKAGSVLGRITPVESQPSIEILDWMDAPSISGSLQSEHPQVIAAVLSHLDPSLAAEVLQQLPIELQADIMLRIANLESIQPDAVQELQAVMQKQIKANAAIRTSAPVGGTSVVAKILNFVRGGADRRIIGELTSLDEEIGQNIQDQMFIFDNLMSLDDKSMGALVRNVDNTVLVPAMKGSDEKMRGKILACMSQRAAQTVQDELESMGPMKVSEVQEAQKRILVIARQMAEAGTIMLGGPGDDYV